MPHFLVPLLRTPGRAHALRVRRTGRLVATCIETAFDSQSRRRGLLGRDEWPAGSALVIAPCNSVHTAFMRFAIDVVFVRRDGRVAKVSSCVRPWRLRASLRAFAVIEMAAGTIHPGDPGPGDLLDIVVCD